MAYREKHSSIGCTPFTAQKGIWPGGWLEAPLDADATIPRANWSAQNLVWREMMDVAMSEQPSRVEDKAGHIVYPDDVKKRILDVAKRLKLYSEGGKGDEHMKAIQEAQAELVQAGSIAAGMAPEEAATTRPGVGGVP